MKYLIGLCMIFFLVSCRDSSLTGKWQVAKIEFSENDIRYSKGIAPFMDFTNKEVLRKSLYQTALAISYKETMKDTSAELNRIDSFIKESPSLGIELKIDSSFKMIHGQVFNPSFLGWYTPKDIFGKWGKNKDTLFLQTDTESDYLTSPMRQTLAYRIIELKEDKLILQELGIREARRIKGEMDQNAYQPSTTITFTRKE